MTWIRRSGRPTRAREPAELPGLLDGLTVPHQFVAVFRIAVADFFDDQLR